LAAPVSTAPQGKLLHHLTVILEWVCKPNPVLAPGALARRSHASVVGSQRRSFI